MKYHLLALIITIITTSCVEPQNTKNKSGVVISMAQAIEMKNKDIKHLDVKEFLKRVEQKDDTMVIVDVRTKKEQMQSMIPGAMPKELFEKHMKHFKGKDIISYCTIGGRSSEYTRELKEKGFKAMSLQGGILSWVHHGGKVYMDDKEVKSIGILNEAWNLMPEGYKGVTP
ncbi:MAG: rhodanese-like domain-containing protein [Bdellovibrionota bacterium]|nr:rhodanese-like domain-containing protein [Bdellovibrionota bacterium]